MATSARKPFPGDDEMKLKTGGGRERIGVKPWAIILDFGGMIG
jgi:hypothetical protein